MENCIAVLDIGKTNKKILIYDQNLNIIDQKKQIIPEIVLDGIPREDIGAIKDWFKRNLSFYAKRFKIKSISISSHGATFVGLDETGQIPIPVISYTHDPGDAFQERFFSRFGHRDQLQRATATPHLGALINPGKGLFFQKESYPEAFDKVKTILYYPQYFGYWLTGKIGADITYTGCHSYLWDFKTNTYSSVARALGVKEMLPQKISKPYAVLGGLRSELAQELGLPKEVMITMGIHDSNSALLPYLITRENDFILNSTGTWCVVMHKEKAVDFKAEDIGKTVFYNISAFGDPVKTTIFMGGLEFDKYNQILQNLHGSGPLPGFAHNLYQSIIDEKACFILPSIVHGSGQFPDSDARATENEISFTFENIEKGKDFPSFFRNREKAYAVLNISLALQTKVSIDRAGMKNGLPIFVEGGFRHNLPYCKILTALYPDSKIYLTNLKEASAYGAAICAKAAVENKHPSLLKDDIHIEMSNVNTVHLNHLEAYLEKFMHMVEQP
jgi:sugar (pentulose or hexulose) kinase